MRKLLGICLLAFLVGCGGSDKKEDKKKDGDKSAALPTSSVPMTNVSWVPVQEETQEEAKSAKAKADEAKAEETVASIIQEFDDATVKFRKAYSAADKEDKRDVVDQLLPQPNKFARRLMKLTEADPSTDEAAKALTWVVQNARGAMATKASDMLAEHHIDSEAMADIAITKVRARPSEKEFEFLQNLIDNSPHERVKGVASFAKVMQLSSANRSFNSLKSALTKAEEEAEESKDDDGEVEEAAATALSKAQRSFDQFGKSIGEDAFKVLGNEETGSGETLESMFTSVSESYGDVVLYQRDPPVTVGDQCAGTLFEIQHLSIGKVAPDIEGEDLDGQSFKLSEYRGKVVVIDFWGDW